MEYTQQFLQSTADLTFSAQQYLWSFLGVKPSENTITQARGVKFADSRPPSVFILGDHQLPMQTLARRIAGISGAAAVAMAAYSAHRGWLLVWGEKLQKKPQGLHLIRVN